MAAVLRVLKSLVYVDWQRRRRMLWIEAWIAIMAVHALLLAAWVVPGGFETTSNALVVWTWGMMLVRVLYFQMGVLLLVIGAGAAIRRHFKMAAVCVPAVLGLVVWPQLNFGLHDSWEHEQGLRIISANLLMVNTNTQPILEEIAASHADVVFLQEYTDHWDRAFRQRFGSTYPYAITDIQEDSFGGAIYSRFPLVGEPVRDNSMGKWKMEQLRVVVDVHGTAVECWNIHLMPPRKFDYTVEHLDEMRDFVRMLADRRDRPVIIAGDFNFTGSTLQARAVEVAGFRDAFADAGVGRGSTWPVNSIFRYLPGIRLDHVFLSTKVWCQSIKTGTGQGSDHRPLVAELVVTEVGK